MTKVETVTIVYEHPKVLLGMKKTKFGRGKYNGFGGKVENGETLEKCAIRETFEEAGIKVKNIEKMGEILFSFQTDEEDHYVHFFKATRYEGNPVESEEMKPEWFNINEIPYNEMWSDDKYWLPLLLSGKKFNGNFVFDGNFQIYQYTLEEVLHLS